MVYKYYGVSTLIPTLKHRKTRTYSELVHEDERLKEGQIFYIYFKLVFCKTDCSNIKFAKVY